ncbi:MAG: YfiM family protein [Hymenobacteraceae bacterium]|nr:YfiM family protein [Hymenobacteraceae bacterium]
MLLLPLQLQAQVSLAPDTTAPPNNRLLNLGIGFSVAYTGTIIALNKAWYQNEPRTGFHFFNDNHEWKQVDKAGHMWAAYHESRIGVDLLRWAKVPEKKAIWYGGMLGFVLQTPIEILDGYQASYGASAGDLIANTVGSAGVISQYLLWQELRIVPKYSFHTTRFAAVRPNVLGSNLPEKALKDYNGQTYWIGVDVPAFLPENSKWPSWLGVAAGYGAEEIVFNDPNTNKAFGFSAYRQYYLAPDINFRKIKTRSKVLKTLFFIADGFHIPAPALEYNRKHGLTGHWLYF